MTNEKTETYGPDYHDYHEGHDEAETGPANLASQIFCVAAAGLIALSPLFLSRPKDATEDAKANSKPPAAIQNENGTSVRSAFRGTSDNAANHKTGHERWSSSITQSIPAIMGSP